MLVKLLKKQLQRRILSAPLHQDLLRQGGIRYKAYVNAFAQLHDLRTVIGDVGKDRERYRGERFKTIGAGQTEGRDREGLTALLKSVATYDPTKHFAGASVTNVNLDPVLIRDDAQFEKTVRLIETYFKNGGAQIQLNAVTREELLQAREDPEKYKSLRVRVSGFSDYFVRLEESMQNNVIERTSLK